jgi:zinc transporter, ZIP family
MKYRTAFDVITRMTQDALLMLDLLLIALLVGCATTIGALPVLVSRELSRPSYDTMLGLGAGLMLAAATLGLLPEALEGARAEGFLQPHVLFVVLAGFVAGVALLFGMDRMIPHSHAGGHHEHMHGHDDGAHEHCEHATVDERARHQGLLIVGAMSLHRLPEGFAIGAAYAARRAPLGLMLAVAIGLQNAIEGAVMAAPLKRGGLGRARLIAIITATGLTVPVSAALGYFMAYEIAGSLPFMLAVAAGALLYLTCNEIIPESHSHGNERRATFGLLAGVIIIVIVKVLVGE